MVADEPPSRNADRTRRAILDAAARLAMSRGSGVSLAEVATEAGVSKSGLLHHFSGRDALFLALAEDAVTRLREAVIANVDLRENHPGKILRAYVRTLCGADGSARDRYAAGAFWNSLHSFPGVAELITAEALRWRHDLCADGLDIDLVLIVKHAAEGLAEAITWDISLTPADLTRSHDLLLEMTTSGDRAH